MCTAATYKTKDFYMGRTLDYECSYGEEVTITPRGYTFMMRHGQPYQTKYALIGMAHVQASIRCIMMRLMKRVLERQVLILSAMHFIQNRQREKRTWHSLN